tara:strand:+ start:2140 stop:2301 length:162 start_codon:yes stop_codon:yes gene_type:complete
MKTRYYQLALLIDISEQDIATGVWTKLFSKNLVSLVTATRPARSTQLTRRKKW